MFPWKETKQNNIEYAFEHRAVLHWKCQLCRICSHFYSQRKRTFISVFSSPLVTGKIRFLLAVRVDMLWRFLKMLPYRQNQINSPKVRVAAEILQVWMAFIKDKSPRVTTFIIRNTFRRLLTEIGCKWIKKKLKDTCFTLEDYKKKRF